MRMGGDIKTHILSPAQIASSPKSLPRYTQENTLRLIICVTSARWNSMHGRLHTQRLPFPRLLHHRCCNHHRRRQHHRTMLRHVWCRSREQIPAPQARHARHVHLLTATHERESQGGGHGVRAWVPAGRCVG